MYPALEEYLNTKVLDPNDFPNTITSYLRVQLDNMRRYHMANTKMAKIYEIMFCHAYEPKSFCSFAILMRKIYTQDFVGRNLSKKIITLYDNLQEKMDFFPLIIYKTKLYMRQPVVKLYNVLSELMSNETVTDTNSVFALHTHLLMLHLAESKSKHDNILVSFLQSLNPVMKLAASEVNATDFLQKCYGDDDDDSFDRYLWNPLLSRSEIVCSSTLFNISLSKISKTPAIGQTHFDKDPAFYRDMFILYAQMMYLQAFDAQEGIATIITQVLTHDQVFELPFSSIISAQTEINGQLNQVLAEEMKTKDIFVWSLLDILQFMTLHGGSTIHKYLYYSGNKYEDKTRNIKMLATTTNVTVAEKLAHSYVSSLFKKETKNQNHILAPFKCIKYLISAMTSRQSDFKSVKDLCIKKSILTKCKQFCQESALLNEVPKVANLSRLLYSTAHPPGYASDRKKTITAGPIPFCLFTKQIQETLKNLSIEFDYPFGEGNSGYSFCNEAFQSYTDSGLCTVINVQKSPGLLNEKYDAIPRFIEKKHSLYFPQRASRRTFEDGIILVLDSWAFNSLVTKTHDSTRSPWFEYQLLQSEKMNNFKVLLHDHNEIPMLLDQENKVIKLDKEKELASVPSFFTKVKVQVQDADENIRTVEVKKRKCRFEDETDGLKLFSTYSKDNCLYECRYQLAKEKCQCVPWNVPHRTTDELCDPVGSSCFRKQILWLSENLNDVENIGSPPCGCYPSCKSYKYIPVWEKYEPKSLKWLNTDKLQDEIQLLKKNNKIVDLSFYSINQFLKHYVFGIFYGKTGTLMPQHENLGPISFFYNESIMPYFASANLPKFRNHSDDLSDRINNIAILYIDFDRSHYTVRRKIKRMTFANMLSSFGGVLGLFTGFSVVGLLDLFFWAKEGIEENLLLRNWNPGGGFAKMKTWMTVKLSRCWKN